MTQGTRHKAQGTRLMAHGTWLMAHGSWHMADGRRISKLLPSVIFHLPSSICHLPSAMPAPKKIMLVRQSPAAQPRRLARRRFRDRDFPPETHAGPRAVELEAADGACIEEVRAGGTARIVNSARARRQQARPPRRECGRRHGEPPGLAGRDGPAPKSRLHGVHE